MLIDTHAHINFKDYKEDGDEVVKRALENNVWLINVGAEADTSRRVVEYSKRNPEGVFAAVGLHPIHIHDQEFSYEKYKKLAQNDKVVAIGEIGLDFFVTSDNRARQEYFFVEQLKLAREFDLPVLLHTRRATDTVLKHLRQNAVRGGIAHAFSGSREQADEFIKLGFKLGFGGAATFLRATRLRELATTLPLSCLVLETDAPDMPPEFVLRGSPNKPEYLLHIAETLASLRGISLTELALATTANARSVLAGLPR